MTNRGRQNVASYLVHDLGVSWTWGAAWFEHHLLDFDAASNTGNWQYLAGVGADPRPQRKFNMEKQAADYDPDGAYRRRWQDRAPDPTP
jgi:deoxyribodipyrimidine photo-lyase